MSKSTTDKLFAASQYVIPKHALSRLVGKLAASETPWIKNAFIRHFAKKFDIDMSEAIEQDPLRYKSFNDFFTRALKEGSRQIDSDKHSIVSPADGAVSQLGNVHQGQLFQAKGQEFSLHDLLGQQPDLTETFNGGQFATIYLSPRDYHRVHMPFAGTLRRSIYVPGELFSVNKATAENVPGLFARNERLVCIFDGEQGPFALVLVGAMIVAGIESVWDGQVCPMPNKITVANYNEDGLRPAVKLAKGEEMGRFKLGSTAIVVTPKDRSKWLDGIKADTTLRMGEAIGEYQD